MSNSIPVPAQHYSNNRQPSVADKPPVLPPKSNHQSEPRSESTNVNIPNINALNENVNVNKVTKLGVKAQSLINLNKPTNGSFNNRTFASRPKLSLETGKLINMQYLVSMRLKFFRIFTVALILFIALAGALTLQNTFLALLKLT